MKNELERFQEIVDDVWELIFGTKRRQKEEDDIGQYIGLTRNKPKRARGDYGRYKADDKSTKDVNEAWVGGKAPKRDKGIGYKK